MKYWVTPEEMTEFDRRAIKNGTLGDVLMERAGTSAARAAMKMTSIEDGTVIVFAGPGNNGGVYHIKRSIEVSCEQAN